MAIAAGDIVMPHRVSTDYTVGYQAQPPTIGACSNVGGPGAFYDVLWETGRRSLSVEGVALDKLWTAAGDPTLVGKVVELAINPDMSLQPSSSYDGIVLGQFRRDPAGDGNLGPDRVVVKLLNSGAYYEADARDVNRLDDR